MNTGRWPRFAVVAVIVTVALFLLTPILAMVGAPGELVGALSGVSLLALAIAFIALVAVSSRRIQWSLTLALIALLAEVAAALLLLVREPQPAFLHPEWAWYWPVVNTLYFGGALIALVAIISAAVGFAMTRSGVTATAFAVALAAVAVNRLASYR